RERRAPAPAVFVLGQGQPGDRRSRLRRRRSEARALLGSPRVDAVGRRAHLLPDRLRESVARDAAVGHVVRDEAARGSDPAVRRATGQPRLTNDYRTSPFAHRAIVEHTGITAALAEPLLYRGELLGVIVLIGDEPGRIFSKQDQELLALIAGRRRWPSATRCCTAPRPRRVGRRRAPPSRRASSSPT